VGTDLEKELLRPAEVAAICGVTRNTVRAQLFGRVRIRGSTFIRGAELRAYLNSESGDRGTSTFGRFSGVHRGEEERRLEAAHTAENRWIAEMLEAKGRARGRRARSSANQPLTASGPENERIGPRAPIPDSFAAIG
jgi:hypothetical protein